MGSLLWVGLDPDMWEGGEERGGVAWWFGFGGWNRFLMGWMDGGDEGGGRREEGGGLEQVGQALVGQVVDRPRWLLYD